MLFKKLIRTMKRYKAQFISMILMFAIGMGVFFGANTEWVTIKKNTTSLFEKTGYADYRLVMKTSFSEEDLLKIQEIEGVERATRFLANNVNVTGTDNVLTLSVTEDITISSFMLIGDGIEYRATDEKGIYLSDQYAKRHDLKVGDSLSLSYLNYEMTGEIRGLVKSGEYMVCLPDSSLIMPDYDTYGFCYVTPQFLEKNLGMTFYNQIHIMSSLTKEEISKEVDRVLDKSVILLSKEEATSYALSEGEIEEGKTMGSILPTLFLLIAILTMITTMHRLTMNEKTQIGILKALGFKDKKIIFHYLSYALFVGIVGSILGIAIGYGMGYMIMNPKGSMGTYMDLPTWHLYVPWYCWVALLGMNLLFVLIAYFSMKHMLQGSASETLRPYTPKKMKRTLLEKSKTWKKMSFGTQWNLRDIMRRKVRTFMTIFGVLGCTILTVGSLGMKDTMNLFVNTFYEKGMNYENRILLKEDISEENALLLAEKYDGDYSGASYVIMNDALQNVEIYNAEHDYVRFINDQEEWIPLENNGIYVCSRIAKENHIQVNDVLSLTYYGTEQKFEMKVIGILRSLSESMVMSEDYAKAISFPYSIQYIYTQEQTIASDANIKAVQSKAKIVQSFGTFMEIMDMMVVLLIVAAIVLGVVVLYNLGVMSFMERYREMATLKVIGFKDNKIGKLLITQNLWTSLVGLIIGIPLGLLTLKYLVVALASEYEMAVTISWLTYLVSTILMLGVTLVVSVFVAKKNKKIQMVESLKYVD